MPSRRLIQRGGHKPEQGLAAYAPHGLQVAQFGDAHHQGTKYQGGNDHLDEEKEDFGE